MKIDVLADVKTKLGEGPLWDSRNGRLFWIDIPDGRVFCCDAAGAGIRAWDTGGRKIGSMALCENGGKAVLALEDGLYFLDFASGRLEFITHPEPHLPANRLNDGKTDRQGRFVFGSMDTREQEKSGSLYRLDADLSVHKIDSGITVSNGPCWSPDGSRFYFADSWAGEIWAYDYDTAAGTVSGRRTFARLDTSDRSAADGSTVDSEGCVWNAQCCSGKIIRYTPEGTVDRIIEMPVKNITSVMFGGGNLDILFVTSMGRKPLPFFPDDNQLRGSLFAVRGLGVTGIPEPYFKG